METILFLAHTETDGTLSKSTLEVLGSVESYASIASGSKFVLGLVGKEVQSAADSIASCSASKFLAASGAEFAAPRYASDAAAAEALVRAAEATIIIAAGTSRWSRVLAGVATRCGGQIDSHVKSISTKGDSPVVSRWCYRQRMEAVLERTKRPWFLLVDPGNSPAWEGASGTASLEAVSVEFSDSTSKTSFKEIREPEAQQQTIQADADLLFVTGAGWTKKQPDGEVHTKRAEEIIMGFLGKTSASLGSSKSLVDMDSEGQGVLPFLSHLNQVGQTGSSPRHPKGLATCCHGEEPHAIGWRFIKERRAINLNANCGWAQGKADVLYVADAFEVMEKVNALLAAK